jgi:hypothetical protein
MERCLASSVVRPSRTMEDKCEADAVGTHEGLTSSLATFIQSLRDKKSGVLLQPPPKLALMGFSPWVGDQESAP